MPRAEGFILTLSCPDTTGIVHAVSGLLLQAGSNIIDSQQFGDVEGEDATGLVFMRVHFAAPAHLAQAAMLESLFSHVRSQFRMDARLRAAATRPRPLPMVSQHGHCLNDLLYRCTSGQLDARIAAVVSNHATHAEPSADDLSAVGRDVERVVLARAVRWHVERRVLMNGHKTVIFR